MGRIKNQMQLSIEKTPYTQPRIISARTKNIPNQLGPVIIRREYVDCNTS